ncbi:Ribose-5-phosphate isomerase a [Thalictrum thalictroides]|uniref:ribose-5-phosphate isomerase n=1 Tax=Thalictrum thalictroides TaxID=46969 RepID=A0A7J6VBE7_THATH|nr:Ribose-5-phosphate isomerase a [Thalictrum thalictroides]
MAISSPPLFLFPESSPMEAPPPPTILTQDELKKIAAYKAVEFVESGMVLGLGTGSTAKHAVDRIAELLHQGKLTNIVGVPTSKKTQEQAISLGIPLSDLDKHPILDLAIDGADEVDPYLNLVKGRGGSLLREKMVESACKKFIVIVDQTKLVKNLGGTGDAVPVEVVPFCWKFTETRLQRLFEEKFEVGCVAKLRVCGKNEEPFVTDNMNYIVDLFFEKEIGDLEAASDEILRLAGVVEHGMFLNMATTVIVAGGAGRSINMVDANMSALRERIENIRTKERLQRCYRVEQAGWCYSSGYDYTLKRDAKLSESLNFMVLVCKTFGLTIATSSSLLCILSVVVYLRFLGQ